MLRTKGGYGHVRGYNGQQSDSGWDWDLPRWSWASPSRPRWQLAEAEEGTFANQHRELSSEGYHEVVPLDEDDRWWVRWYGVLVVNLLYKPLQIIVWLVKPLAKFVHELATSLSLAIRHFTLVIIRALTPGPAWRAILIFIVLFLWMFVGIPCLIMWIGPKGSHRRG